MFPDPTATWKPVVSPIKDLAQPNLEVVGAVCGGFFECVVAEWATNRLRRAWRVRFENPMAFFAVEEMLYSVAGHSDGSSVNRGGDYLRESTNSAFLGRLQEADPFERKFRHFLLVGLDTCLEVIDTDLPTITEFESYDSAFASAQEACLNV